LGYLLAGLLGGTNFWALALQAGLNQIGPKYQNDWQELKLDGEIGPKTTDAFNRVSASAGPMAMAEGIGNFLGWL
ncbi:MAG: hypothetical protein HQL44_16800, partial [Alphaproteobacteria bacterium]|nr:hypothetical protein [Alphaproteobacteria bacterium]